MKMEQPRLYPSTFRQVTIWALYVAIAMPVIYFGTQLVAAPFYPDYSFSQDTASMLGTTDSRHPWIFNLGAIVTGAAGLAGAFGLFRALRTVTWTALAGLVALCVVANRVLSVKAGIFPMPDPRHASWQFLMPAILATPLLLLVALWRQGVALRAYLLQPDAQCLPLQKFRDDRGRAFVLAKIINGQNVGTIQRRNRLRLLMEPSHPPRIARKQPAESSPPRRDLAAYRRPDTPRPSRQRLPVPRHRTDRASYPR